jgi:signal transduction histidine kinase
VSLVWRILLVSLLLNVLTVGSVQVVVYLSQQEWFRSERNSMLEAVLESLSVLERVYAPGRLGDASQVRPLVRNSALREVYDDVILTSGRPPYEGTINLNPRGAVHRDPDAFPRAEIQAGMERSRDVFGLLPVAGGYCYCVRQGESVAGYVWFVPKHPEASPTLPLLLTALAALGIGTLLFAGLLTWHMRRAVGRPLQAVGEAAAAVARGRYDVRLPEQRSIAELLPVVTTFNQMAEQVGQNTATLEDAVRRAVEQTKQQERALVLSSRLASIGTLAAGVAHEINNPIGGMQNAVHRLLQAEGLPDKQRTYLQLVQDGLSRIGRTARRLLDFSPRPAAAGSLSVAAAIDGARALVEHRVQTQRVQLDVDVPRDLPKVHGDAHEIQQVVLNLLLNSLDALAEKAADAEGRGGRITVRAHVADGKVVLEVEDDGPGMATEDLGRVFDPFFTRKSRPDASGLGMFICYSIVQSHGGEMTVDSRPGQGFRTRIVLPANG